MSLFDWFKVFIPTAFVVPTLVTVKLTTDGNKILVSDGVEKIYIDELQEDKERRGKFWAERDPVLNQTKPGQKTKRTISVEQEVIKKNLEDQKKKEAESKPKEKTKREGTEKFNFLMKILSKVKDLDISPYTEASSKPANLEALLDDDDSLKNSFEDEEDNPVDGHSSEGLPYEELSGGSDPSDSDGLDGGQGGGEPNGSEGAVVAQTNGALDNENSESGEVGSPGESGPSGDGVSPSDQVPEGPSGSPEDLSTSSGSPDGKNGASGEKPSVDGDSIDQEDLAEDEDEEDEGEEEEDDDEEESGLGGLGGEKGQIEDQSGHVESGKDGNPPSEGEPDSPQDSETGPEDHGKDGSPQQDVEGKKSDEGNEAGEAKEGISGEASDVLGGDDQKAGKEGENLETGNKAQDDANALEGGPNLPGPEGKEPLGSLEPPQEIDFSSWTPSGGAQGPDGAALKITCTDIVRDSGNKITGKSGKGLSSGANWLQTHTSIDRLLNCFKNMPRQ